MWKYPVGYSTWNWYSLCERSLVKFPQGECGFLIHCPIRETDQATYLTLVQNCCSVWKFLRCTTSIGRPNAASSCCMSGFTSRREWVVTYKVTSKNMWPNIGKWGWQWRLANKCLKCLAPPQFAKICILNSQNILKNSCTNILKSSHFLNLINISLDNTSP